MGQKSVRFGGLRGTRSRQDESKEVHEVGSKRPSLGCNGVGSEQIDQQGGGTLLLSASELLVQRQRSK
jgi:hypothetical protein